MTEEGKEEFKEFPLSDDEDVKLSPLGEDLQTPLATKAAITLTESTHRRASYVGIGDQVRTSVRRKSTSGVPTSDIFLKLTSFQSSDFQVKWAVLVFLCNVYNCFSAPLFVGTLYQPQEVWLGLEVGVEAVLLVDCVARLVLGGTHCWRKMWMLHDSESWRFRVIRLILSSLPYSVLISALRSYSLAEDYEMQIALLRLFKLLRVTQLLDFSTSVELISKSRHLFLLRVLRLLVVLLALTHLGTVCFLVVIQVESTYSDIKSWYMHTEELARYVDGWFWAACTMAGVGFGDIVPHTDLERFITIVFIVVGSSFYAEIFGQMVLAMHTIHQQSSEDSFNRQQALQWARERKLGTKIVERLQNYYTLVRIHYRHISNSAFLNQLPLSLRTEISMFLYEDLIQKVKLFELGDPSFILAVVRHLVPRIYMQEDFVIHRGDIADEFFFLQQGSVAVLTTDESLIIAMLSEGAYFGEIGVLLQSKRSASVKATTSVLASAINKEHLTAILKNFPDQEAFLIRIGRQRLRTTAPEDLDQSFCLIPPEETNSESLFVPSKDPRSLWRRLIPKWIPSLEPLIFIYYFIYVPMAFAFRFRLQGAGMGWDLFTILYSWLMISMRIRDDPANYSSTSFTYEAAAALPVDYVLYGLGQSTDICNAFMVICRQFLRLVKGISAVKHWQVRKLMSSNPRLKLLVYFFLLATYIHLASCVFFIVAQQQTDGWFAVFDSMPYTHFGPMEELPVSHQYILVLYVILMSVGDADGPLGPQTPAEKMTIFITMVLSKVFLAFVYAEAVTLISFSHELYTHHLQRVTVVSGWMNHLKLPLALRERVDKYYDMLWLKLKGFHDSEIMNDLPESLRTDIASVLFASFTSSDLLSSCDQGALLAIIRRCKVNMACAGETIIAEGELGLEMFFILEGSVEVVASGGVVLGVLEEGQPFGEMALLSAVPTLRMANVVAKTDVSLAVLSLEDFRLVMDSYPEFQSLMLEKTRIRLLDNQHKMQQSGAIKFAVSDLNVAEEENHPCSMESARSETSQPFSPLSPLSAPVITTAAKEEMETGVTRNRNSVHIVSQIQLFRRKYSLEGLVRILHWLVLLTTLYNLIIMPLVIGFRLRFLGAVLAFEVLTVLTYVLHLAFEWSKLSVWQIVYRVAVTLPFAWACDSLDSPHWVLTILALVRIADVSPLFQLFTSLKARNCNWVNVLRVLEVLFFYLLLCHLVGMIMLSLAIIEDDPVENWVRYRAPPHERMEVGYLTQGDIYVCGVFWATLEVSHRGVGDVVNGTILERACSCVLMFVLNFMHAMLFGNFTSLVSSLASRLRSKLHRQYKIVMEVITKKKLSKSFIKQISDYFAYIWSANQGLSEDQLLSELPASLQADIQVARYGGILQRSKFLRDSMDGQLNLHLARSVLRIMKVRHYLQSDSIVNAGDKGTEMFFLLHGEVQVVSMEGRRILGVLEPGDYFGEANLLFQWTKRRTASVICSSLVTVGVIEAKHLKMLLEAYPEWERMLVQQAFDRLKETFQSEDVEEMKARLHKIAATFAADPDFYHRTIQRRRTLTAPMFMSIVAPPPKQHQLWPDLLHLVVIMYTCAFMPLAVGFRLEVPAPLLIMEVLCILESFFFLLRSARPRAFFEAHKSWKFRETWSYYFHNGLLVDLATLSPCFVVFSFLDMDELWTLPLKLLRLACALRIGAIIEVVEMRYRAMTRPLHFMRTLLFLLLLVHWTTCTWQYVTTASKTGVSWFSFHHLEHESLAGQYLFASYYTLSFVSTVAYGDQKPFSTGERLTTILAVLAGDALFGVAFGMMAELAISAETKYSSYLKELRNAMDYLAQYQLSSSLITRLEQYFAYRWAITEEVGLTNLDDLYTHLPTNIVEKIMYESNKSIIRRLPILSNYGSEALIQLMSTKLKPEIYFPHDYVIYQDDIGEEMYFIIEGVIEVLAPGGDKTIAELRKGEYLGELALIQEAKRPFTALAKSFCLLYILQKAAFLEILEEYPDVKRLIQESSRASRESTQVKRRDRKSMTLGAPAEPSDDEFYNLLGWSMVSRDQMKKRMASKV
jgi:voltage-gated potassium channel